MMRYLSRFTINCNLRRYTASGGTNYVIFAGAARMETDGTSYPALFKVNADTTANGAGTEMYLDDTAVQVTSACEVWQCRLKPVEPRVENRLVSAIETIFLFIVLILCCQVQLAPLRRGCDGFETGPVLNLHRSDKARIVW